MFRLQRNKSQLNCSGKKIDFKFSKFQAVQVPKGWKDLFVSTISVETGKSIAMSNKALVQNGQCQWTDTLSESIWIPPDDISKELEEKILKFVVASGSARPGMLGEATVNMRGYMSSSAPITLSLPLKNCIYGTILKVKIDRISPKSKFRNKESKDKGDRVDMKSNGSDSTGTRSVGFTSKSSLNSTTHPEELQNWETSFSSSATSQSCDSLESSRGTGSEILSPRNKSNGDGHNLIGIQNSNGLENGAPHGRKSVEDTSQSNHSSFNSRVGGLDDNSQNHCQEFAQSISLGIAAPSLRNADSSETLMEAAKDIVEEIQKDKMWAMKADKSMFDLNVLRKEFSDQLKKLADMEKDLSAACAERDGLKKEVEQLNFLLEESTVKQTATDTLRLQGNGVPYIQEEFEKEIKFQQESNATLAQQLKKSQESNVELVLVLQELEATIEKQKIELEKISCLWLEFSTTELTMQRNLEENQELVHQLHQLEESEKNLQVKVQLLEQALEDKVHEIHSERILNKQSLFDTEEIDINKLASKKEKNGSVEANFCDFLEEQSSEETVSINGSNVDLIREIETLKEKVEELERDCNELTEENLELLIKLKESKTNSGKEGLSCDFSSDLLPVNSFFSSESEVGKIKFQVYHMEELPEKKVDGEDQLASSETSTVLIKLCKQLQMAFSQLKKPWFETSLCLNSNPVYDLDNFVKVNSADAITHKVLAEFILKYLVELNKLLETRSTDSEEGDRRSAKTEEWENYLDLEQKLQDTQSRLTEAQEEYEYLKMENPKLQATCESLGEECSSLQKLNGDLRKQKLELHEHFVDLEAELRKSQKNSTDYHRKVEDLEAKLSSVLEDFASKENWLNSELDALLEDSMYKEQLILKESMLNDMLIEKTVEVEKLQREVEHLTEQFFSTRDGRERIAAEAVHEVKSFHADKVGLEFSLQKAQLKVQLTENKLYNVQKESETKVEDLMNELADSTKKLEIMAVDHGKMLNLLENQKLNEEKLKTIMKSLELNLTASENECHQLLEETANLKVQVQKIEILQDEVLNLKGKLSSTNSEKEKLEASQRLLYGYCDELKAEKVALIEKIYALQSAVSDLEDCERTRVVLCMEGDRVAREALCAEGAELKNELSQIKRANGQLQKKIQQLEVEKDELSNRVEALREELKLLMEEKKGQSETCNAKIPGVPKVGSRVASNPEDVKLSMNDMVKGCDQHCEAKEKPHVKISQAQKPSKDQLNRKQSQHHRESLEDDLPEALETNNMYKVQPNRLVSEGGSGHADPANKSTFKDNVVSKERYERTKSSLEAELRDIRERYLHMSLKYAEAEAQHEEIVMKLKGPKSVKRWFS